METWNRAAAAHSRGAGVPAPPPPRQAREPRHRQQGPRAAAAPAAPAARAQGRGFRASSPPAAPCPREAAPEAAAAAPAMWDPRAARCVAARGTRGAPPACRAPRLFPAGRGGVRGPATPEAAAERSSPWAPRAPPAPRAPRSSSCRPGPVVRGRARGAAPAFPAPGDEGTRCDRTAAARGLPGPHPGTEASDPGPTSHLQLGTPGPLSRCR